MKQPHYSQNREKTSKFDSFEVIEFVDKLKDRDVSESTVIVDYVNKKIVKDRTKQVTFDSIIDHANTNYADHMKKLNAVVANMAKEYESNNIENEIVLRAKELDKKSDIWK